MVINDKDIIRGDLDEDLTMNGVLKHPTKCLRNSHMFNLILTPSLDMNHICFLNSALQHNHLQ